MMTDVAAQLQPLPWIFLLIRWNFLTAVPTQTAMRNSAFLKEHWAPANLTHSHKGILESATSSTRTTFRLDTLTF